MIVSLNGVDNVGKTTQIRLLSSNSYLIKTKGLTFPTWPKFLTTEDFSNFWFKSRPTELFTIDIFASLNARTESYSTVNKCRNSIIILDRGYMMFKAVCIATSMIKDDINEEKATELIEKIIEKSKSKQDEYLVILLKHGNTIDESIEKTLSRENKSVNDIYKKYQYYLNNILDKAVNNNDNKLMLKIVHCEGKSILDIQNEIRSLIKSAYDEYLKRRSEYTELANGNGDLYWGPCFNTLKTIIGLGGLSESGKSYCGMYLFEKHNTLRLKIIYFVDCVARLENISVEEFYTKDSTLQAELVVIEIDKFLSKHYYYDYVTIESLRNFDFVLHLKRLLGNKFKILYLDATKENRYKRGTQLDKDMFYEKEASKMKNGANEIAKIADKVLNNNNDVETLNNELDKFIESLRRNILI